MLQNWSSMTDKTADRLQKFGADVHWNKAAFSDSFGHKWWVLACLHASSSLDVVKVPLSFPLRRML
jgi:hypothetical protein